MQIPVIGTIPSIPIPIPFANFGMELTHNSHFSHGIGARTPTPIFPPFRLPARAAALDRPLIKPIRGPKTPMPRMRPTWTFLTRTWVWSSNLGCGMSSYSSLVRDLSNNHSFNQLVVMMTLQVNVMGEAKTDSKLRTFSKSQSTNT